MDEINDFTDLLNSIFFNGLLRVHKLVKMNTDTVYVKFYEMFRLQKIL